MFKIFVIVPVWQGEKRNLEQTLKSLAKLPYKTIIVDDGSTDATFEIAKRQSGLIVLRHIINRGQGAALATGTKKALALNADIIVHFDSDGQFLAEEIESVVEPLLRDPELDIVLGSRYLGQKKNQVPWLKKYLLQKPALLFQFLTTGLRLTDVHNGFRALRARAAEQIEIKQDRMAHASEIVSEIKRNHLRYTEVPVTVVYNEFGQGLGGGIKILMSLFIRKIIK